MSLASSCPTVADLRLLVTGHLDQSRAGELEDHLRGCASCRAVRRQMHGADTVQTIDRPARPEAGASTIPPRGEAPADALMRAGVPGYEILAELGRGGMGVVYQARQVGLNRTVALKMILAGAHADDRDLTRFRTEAEAVARLQHPNIVQIYEVGAHAGLPYFSLEFCAGGSLAAWLDGTPVPPAPAARLVETLARAMDYAHQRGVVHRDLKPANILLQELNHRGTEDTEANTASNSEGKDQRLPTPSLASSSVPSVPLWFHSTPKVADFGLAKKLDAAAQTQSGAVVGTPSYMAPEQAQGQTREVGPAADVYALGAILYELLTGRPPFKAATPLDTLLQVVCDEPVPPSRLVAKLPRDLETICLKCLHKEPAKRYATAGALAEDLRRFGAGEPIVARPVGRAERAVKWVRRNKALAGFLAALAVLLIGGSGAGLWYRAQREEAGRKQDLTRQAVSQSLAQAQAGRAQLLAALQRPDGVQGLLNQSARWEAQLKAARGDWQRAKALADGAEGSPDPDLARRLRELDEQLTRDRADYELALRLEQIRLDRVTARGRTYDDARAEQAYPRAFHDAGLAVAPGREPEVAGRIGRSAIKDQLLVGLDDWAYLARQSKKEDLWRRLLDVARRVDPDPWRRRVRDPKRWTNRAAMGKLAEAILADRATLARLSPQLLYLVGRSVPEAGQVRWLRRAQALHPTDFWLNLELAFALAKSKDRAWEGVGFLRVALAIRPQTPAVYNDLGVALRQLKDLPAAAKALDKAVALDPRCLNAWYNLGQVLREQDEPAAAIRAYRKALEIDPRFAECWYRLGLALADQKDLAGAVEAHRRAVAIDPKLATAWYELGLALYHHKDLPPDQQKALAVKLGSDVAWYNHGVTLHRKGDLPAAIEAYKKALQANPRLAHAWTGIASALDDQHKLPAAIDAYKKALALDPRHPVAWRNLGVALSRYGDDDEAIRVCKKALDLNPKYFEAWTTLGNALRHKGELAAAVEAHKKSLALNARYFEGWVNFGYTLHAQKNWPAAADAFRKALDLDRRSAVAWNALGATRHDQKDYAAAVEAYRKALAINPNYAGAWINLGSVFLDQNNADGAVEAYRKALTLDPRQAMGWYNLGNLLRKQKDYPAAGDAYRSCLRYNPTFAQAHCNLGHTLKDLGQLRAALAALERGHELGTRTKGWRYPSADWVKQCRQLIALDAELTAFLKRPTATAAERLRLADRSADVKLRCADVVKLYASAFAADPGTAEARNDKRYNAACTAALAAAGEGIYPGRRPAVDPPRLRRQALVWLQADLAAWARLLERQPLEAARVQAELQHWQGDADLAALRDAKELARLPETERAAWTKLWADVAALRQKARGRYVETVHQGQLGPKEREKSHPVPMTAGTTYVIELAGGQVGASLRLHDEQGKRVAEAGAGKETGTVRLEFTPSRAGGYRVVAASAMRAGAGGYTLTIRAFGDGKK